MDTLEDTVCAISFQPIPPGRVVLLGQTAVDIEVLLMQIVHDKLFVSPFDRSPLPDQLLQRIKTYRSSRFVKIHIANNIAKPFSSRAEAIVLRDYFKTVGDIIVDCGMLAKQPKAIRAMQVSILDQQTGQQVSLWDLDPHTWIEDFANTERFVSITMTPGNNTKDVSKFEDYICKTSRHTRLMRLLKLGPKNDEEENNHDDMFRRLMEAMMGQRAPDTTPDTTPDTAPVLPLPIVLYGEPDANLDYASLPSRASGRRQPGLNPLLRDFCWYPEAVSGGDFIWNITTEEESGSRVVASYNWSPLPRDLAQLVDEFNTNDEKEDAARDQLLGHPLLSPQCKEFMLATSARELPNPRCITRNPKILEYLGADALCWSPMVNTLGVVWDLVPAESIAYYQEVDVDYSDGFTNLCGLVKRYNETNASVIDPILLQCIGPIAQERVVRELQLPLDGVMMFKGDREFIQKGILQRMLCWNDNMRLELSGVFSGRINDEIRSLLHAHNNQLEAGINEALNYPLGLAHILAPDTLTIARDGFKLPVHSSTGRVGTD